ncbi:MAG TPA: site-specific DNA-methyltransferase [Parapedobacter sp.]|nr:site-specific DNA-methyltransferase [Parapedobacter sp.]HWK58714.1 site-specific DNA-methyltransferase [Parapedobacter sp.]
MSELNKILIGDALARLKELPDGIAHTCVTSPPYYGLRDYGVACQIGMEATPEEYIDKLVTVFREVRRVLRDDGTLWVNIGDSYASAAKKRTDEQACRKSGLMGGKGNQIACKNQPKKMGPGLKQKDLIGIPWMLAFALRADGWYLRQDIIWSKPNCMPESVTDRCTKSHEYIFMLSKQPKYYYDHEAIKELAVYDVDGTGTAARKARVANSNKSVPDELRNGIRAGFKDASKFNGKHNDKQRGHSRRHEGFNARWDHMTKREQGPGMRNKRSVWTVSPAQFHEAHFATFPEKLIVDCIKAGSPQGGVVIDPFGGAGTTAVVSDKLGRYWIIIELNPAYGDISTNRVASSQGLFQFNRVG